MNVFCKILHAWRNRKHTKFCFIALQNGRACEILFCIISRNRMHAKYIFESFRGTGHMQREKGELGFLFFARNISQNTKQCKVDGCFAKIREQEERKEGMGWEWRWERGSGWGQGQGQGQGQRQGQGRGREQGQGRG
jgi:hypothetical protein